MPRISSTLPIGFRLDLVQVAFAIAADPGGLAVEVRQKAFRDLSSFADHAIIDLRTHALVIVDAPEPDIEQLNAEHLNFF